jgi:hypothetical protein
VEPSFTVPASFRPVFTAGATVSRGIRTLLDKPVQLLGLTFLSILPIAALYGLLFLQISPAEFQEAAASGDNLYPAWFWPAYLVAVLLSTVPAAATIHATTRHLQGQALNVGESLGVGFRRVLPFTLVNFIFGVLVGLGTVALLVPGIILACIFFMCGPVAVNERRGIFGALGRAAALSKGYRTTLFAIGAALFGIWLAVGLGVLLYTMLIGVLANIAGPVVGLVLGVPVAVVVYLGLAALFPIFLGASYVGLCEEKEVGSADQVAGVFS